jgi:cbb3-type cytochrome oxidase subunit 3
VFFILLIFWAFKANKNLITAMKNIPLDDNQQNN